VYTAVNCVGNRGGLGKMVWCGAKVWVGAHLGAVWALVHDITQQHQVVCLGVEFAGLQQLLQLLAAAMDVTDEDEATWLQLCCWDADVGGNRHRVACSSVRAIELSATLYTAITQHTQPVVKVYVTGGRRQGTAIQPP